MTLYPQCPTPNANGRCGCKGACMECGMKRHTVAHGTPSEDQPQYVHEFVSVQDHEKQTGGK